MAQQGSVAGFRASVNGLRFTNSFPKTPVMVVDVRPLGRLPIGDASGGLCGGMVYTVRDLFEAGRQPPAETTTPAFGTPLFRYLVSRLFASFDLPSGVLEYYAWMIRPDRDSRFWFARRRGVAWQTITRQWPLVRDDIDAGRLSPLGLVTVRGADPQQLRHNHQVLAYAYEVDDADVLTLHVYDPNTPAAQADDVRLTLSLRDPSRATPITHNVNIARGIRGFFRTGYSFSDPVDAFA